MSTLEVISLIVMIISILISLICLKYTFQTKKRYEKVAMKLGNGTDISEILKDYIKKVNQLDVKDDQIIEYCNKLNNDSFKYIEKIGLVNYNSFEDTRNKLSFTLALLNKDNSGIVLNSIYTKDGGSNIYAKEVVKGTSKSNLSSEEEQAINKAMNKKKEIKS